MQFNQFTRVISENTILFKNENPVLGVDTIKYYRDDASGLFRKKEYRWSFNNDYWSSWTDLNQGNISKLQTNRQSYLFLEVRYVQTSANSGNVTSFVIEYKQLSGDQCPPLTPEQPAPKANIDHCHIPGSEILPGSLVKTEVIKVNDSELLNGQPGEYYLLRSNHKGEQPISSITGLQKLINTYSSNINYLRNNAIQDGLNIDGSGIGLMYRNEPSILFFKRIIGGTGTNIVEKDGVITVNVDASIATYDPSVNELYNLFESLSVDLNDLSIYVDSEFYRIDQSINELYNKDASSLKDFENIGIGTGKLYKGTDGGNVGQLRTLSGAGDVSISTVGDEVVIFIDSSVSGETRWTDPDPVSELVGGINPGETFVGENSIDILDKMLYGYNNPILNISTLPHDYLLEKYSNNSLISDVSIFGDMNNTPFIKAKLNQIQIFKKGYLLYSQAYPGVDSGSFITNDAAGLTGTDAWDDCEYTVKLTDNMNPNTTDASITYKFVNPYYFGIVQDNININNINPDDIVNMNKLLVDKQSNEILFDNSLGYQKIKFVYAYDADYEDLSSIFDIANNFNVTTSFETGIKNLPTDASILVPFKVYIKEHWISVSEFKLLFNI